jgi:hypothetical protein
MSSYKDSIRRRSKRKQVGAATICGHPECDNDSVLGECSRSPEPRETAAPETDERYNVSDALVEQLRERAPDRDYFEALSDLLRLRAERAGL